MTSLTMMLGWCWGGRLVINTKTTGFVYYVVSLAEVAHHLLHVQILGGTLHRRIKYQQGLDKNDLLSTTTMVRYKSD